MNRNIAGMLYWVTILILSLQVNGLNPKIYARSANGDSLLSVNFTLTGKNYKFKLPEGFCIPSGKDSILAESIASIDSRNMTHFTIIPCEEAESDTDFTRWGMLKTPRGSIGKRIPTRQQWVRDARNSIKTHDYQDFLADAKKYVNKTYQDVFGDNVKIGMHMEMVDADEYAGYMTGTMLLEVSGRKMLTAAAGALTVVRGNVFFYYRYSPYKNLSDLVKLLKQVKSEIHRFVTDNPG